MQKQKTLPLFLALTFITLTALATVNADDDDDNGSGCGCARNFLSQEDNNDDEDESRRDYKCTWICQSLEDCALIERFALVRQYLTTDEDCEWTCQDVFSSDEVECTYDAMKPDDEFDERCDAVAACFDLPTGDEDISDDDIGPECDFGEAEENACPGANEITASSSGLNYDSCQAFCGEYYPDYYQECDFCFCCNYDLFDDDEPECDLEEATESACTGSEETVYSGKYNSWDGCIESCDGANSEYNYYCEYCFCCID